MFAFQSFYMKYLLIVFSIVLLLSCNRQTRNNDDSKSNMDSSISMNNILTENNPYRIRDSIKRFAIIPKLNLNAKLKIFKSLIDSLQNCYISNEVNQYVEIDKYNYLIIKYIQNIVENHSIVPEILAKDPIKLVRSPDQKVGVYTWDEHAGSTMSSNINILVYRTSDNKMKTIHLEWINRNIEHLTYAGVVKKIYLLSSKKDERIYMIQAEGSTCSNCYFSSMIGFSISYNNLNLKYPLFGNSSDYLFESRDSSLIEFNYNSKIKEFSVSYMVENRSLDTASENIYSISEKWIFNGEKFVLYPFED